MKRPNFAEAYDRAQQGIIDDSPVASLTFGGAAKQQAIVPSGDATVAARLATSKRPSGRRKATRSKTRPAA